MSVRGRSGFLATPGASFGTDDVPSTVARRGLSATASRYQRMIAATWVRNMASSPATASSLSTNTTAGPVIVLTALSSKVSSFSGLNTSSSDTSWTVASTAAAAAATNSDLPQPAGPSRSTPATLGSLQAAGRSAAEVSKESHPVRISSSVSRPASNASAVVRASPPGWPSGCCTTAAGSSPSWWTTVASPKRPAGPGMTDTTSSSMVVESSDP